MGKSLAYKILEDHLVEGALTPGSEIGIRIDHTLTQDATGTMAYLQFEAMGFERVATELSVSYVDHNTLQSGFENADDHRYLRTVAGKYGVVFSPPGNGICHQVHLERFGAPGKTMLGSDSHTPTGGGLGMIAIGAGGLDVAVAMGGGPFYMPCPKVLGVKLTGRLRPWVSAKDVILEVLRRRSVKGGVGFIVEYFGSGIESLTVTDRATICNMGAELGATTSLFPSDENTRKFLAAQEREDDYRPLAADDDTEYHELVEIDLGELVPLVALPHMPDKVVAVSEAAGRKLDQVCVGSCTNGSLRDMLAVAAILEGEHVASTLSFTVSPGSKQVLKMISLDGSLAKMVAAGARILESTCGPCIGMGQSPPSAAHTLRSFNRNFLGRSGTKDANVYLASAEICAISAIKGEICDPIVGGEQFPEITLPERFNVDDTSFVKPADDPSAVEVMYGPNIVKLEPFSEMADTIRAEVLLKTEDNITTDHIMPAGARILPFRSNIPRISDFVYEVVDPTFPERARKAGRGIIVGGDNYGQGSSREHAGLAPRYLGIEAKITKGYARIHRANLVNFGILPLIFKDETDYDRIEKGDVLVIENARGQVKAGNEVTVRNETKDYEFTAVHDLSEREVAIVIAGGKLNYTRKTAG
ncbi:aconitate hydratase [bacterium]|nr:aconitate hydratase [bacterium]